MTTYEKFASAAAILIMLLAVFSAAVNRVPEETGAEPEQDRESVTEPEQERRTEGEVGSWVDTAFGGSYRAELTIVREGDAYFLLSEYFDGSSGKQELDRSSPSGSDRALFFLRGSGTGDYFVIDRRGYLELRDREGLIRVARPR